MVLGIFLILYRFWIIYQDQRGPGFYTLKETKFINNPGSKQSKNTPNTLLSTLVNRKRVQNFSKKY